VGPDAAIEAFVGEVREAFARATAVGEVSTSALRIAGRRVSLTIVGSALAATYSPALAHRVDAPAAPDAGADLQIRCWERAATGVGPPPPPWSLDDFLPRGRIRGLVNDRIRVTYDEAARTLTVYDRDAEIAYVHAAEARQIPPWVARSPLRNVFTWWAGDRGFAFLHASAVADGGGAVALAGASGSGKSTTALTCVTHGLTFLADDACVATVDPGSPSTLFPVYGFAKLERDMLRHLPEVAGSIVDRAADQLVVELPDVCREGTPLRAVLLPRVAHTAHTRVEPVTRRDALRTLVPGSLLEGDGAGGTSLAALTRLVQRVPCYRLHLGTDRAAVVGAVQEMLAA